MSKLIVGIRKIINQTIRIFVQEILSRNYGMAKFFLCGLPGNASDTTSLFGNFSILFKSFRLFLLRNLSSILPNLSLATL